MTCIIVTQRSRRAQTVLEHSVEEIEHQKNRDLLFCVSNVMALFK